MAILCQLRGLAAHGAVLSLAFQAPSALKPKTCQTTAIGGAAEAFPCSSPSVLPLAGAVLLWMALCQRVCVPMLPRESPVPVPVRCGTCPDEL
ncbi:hypothetical protein EK904_009836 [Melospiza melodia maxima]|nr:hypothetical protein EK904_009836 [Melospiza melodia maxima]